MGTPEEIGYALRCLRRRGIRRWGSSRAAMAVTIVTGADGPAVLLTRRGDSLHLHAGQWALPGGRADRWESASGAARRQLAENLGMRLPPESVLGLLDDHAIDNRLVITPVVLWAGEHGDHLRLSQRLQQARADDVLAVPFTDLDVEPVFVASSESESSVIRLPLHGGWLPAPTAAVLHQFREVVLHRRRTRVAHR
ncbi:MAG: coenzyme A pyrophosphatase [Pseudonocardiales bacterium]|nr:NUDIX domain-containing protein [Actinomycetota bacterium]PZS24545.1 MAG: coenzyme A pyrophosphatase [Pseudonocardiales bacterium]